MEVQPCSLAPRVTTTRLLVCLVQVPKQGAGAIDVYAAITSRQRASPSALPLGEVVLGCGSMFTTALSLASVLCGSHAACVLVICAQTHAACVYSTICSWREGSCRQVCTDADQSLVCRHTGVANKAVTKKITIKNLDNRRTRFVLSFKPTLAQPFPGPGVT